jgi:hypothetical protein
LNPIVQILGRVRKVGLALAAHITLFPWLAKTKSDFSLFSV